MQPLVREAILCSEQLLEALQAEKLDFELIEALEKERKERIHHLFQQVPPEQLQVELKALETMKLLDEKLLALFQDKKHELGNQILQLMRGKAKTDAYADAYKVNKF